MAPLPLSDVALRLHPADDVAVLKRALPAGVELLDGDLRLILPHPIPAGHKVALQSLNDGAPVRKYGQIIGFVRGGIAPGEHVHLHNLAVRDFNRDCEFGVSVQPVAFTPADERRTFLGYRRPGGRVGTRNYLAVISSVNCSASVSKYVADRFRNDNSDGLRRDFPGVDGVIAFTHKAGCNVSLDEATRILQQTLVGVARHPNIAGYLMIGLGCETNQITEIVDRYRLNDFEPGEQPPVFMNIQATGGVRKTVDRAVAAVRELLPAANLIRRSPVTVEHLILAENCGGSDANSGITANPALGWAADELVRQGGTAVLAETPEIYGAEHLLTRRAATREVGEKLLALIRWWEAHARLHNASIDNNPSPGNKEGGLTTIYEKSLGAVAKGGTTPLNAVYKYAEPVTAKGFCFMDTPGYDPVSMTGLMAGGCNVGVFTTGRGSVYGCKPMPCIKVATNTALFERQRDDMDLNAGTILDGSETIEQVGKRLFDKIVAVAGGEKTRSELDNIGDEEFAPWHLGPIF